MSEIKKEGEVKYEIVKSFCENCKTECDHAISKFRPNILICAFCGETKEDK